MVSVRDPVGLLALLFLIPLIILYLFSRRPTKKIFSSLMFFIKDNNQTKKYSFFKRLMSNLVFFLQLLAICLLAFAAATPILKIPQNTTEEHILIIIDTSASMQSKFGLSSTRFDEAIKDATSLVKSKNKVSIILAEDIPLVVLDKKSSDKAIKILNNIQASESKSNIPDSMIQALTIMNKGTVYVFSDFSFSEDLTVIKQQLNAKGINVIYKEFNEPIRNVGIISADIYEDEVRLKIKNFDKNDLSFNVKSENKIKPIEIASNSIKEISFDLKPGNNIFELIVNDEFAPDNKIYVSNPKKGKIKTLYISNFLGKDYLKTALKSLNKLEITETYLPVIPNEDFDLYIIKDIDKSKILPTTFDDIFRKTKTGSSIILNLQKDSNSIDYQKLQLIDLNSLKENGVFVRKKNNIVTSDVEFGETEFYFSTSNEKCDPWVISKDNETIICEKKRDDGYIIINGIMNQYSEFKNTPDYPVFWSFLLDYLFPKEEDKNVNYKTGKIIPLEYQIVNTPGGEIETNKLILNKAGFYTFENETIGVNLLDYDESNINTKLELDKSLNHFSNRLSSEAKEMDLSKFLFIIGLIIIIIELFIIKWRGDL